LREVNVALLHRILLIEGVAHEAILSKEQTVTLDPYHGRWVVKSSSGGHQTSWLGPGVLVLVLRQLIIHIGDPGGLFE
jgi:hypothetical protein